MIKLDIEKLLKLIEVLRQEMYELVEKKGLIDDEVIKKSEELDELLKEYYHLLDAKKKDD